MACTKSEEETWLNYTIQPLFRKYFIGISFVQLLATILSKPFMIIWQIICRLRNVEWSYFMVVRMLTKRQIYCQIFIKALNSKRHVSLLLQAVARMKWNQRNAWQMVEYCSSATFLSLSSLQPSFIISRSTNHTETQRIIYKVKYIKRS